jgi:hypothetical protein
MLQHTEVQTNAKENFNTAFRKNQRNQDEFHTEFEKQWLERENSSRISIEAISQQKPKTSEKSSQPNATKSQRKRIILLNIENRAWINPMNLLARRESRWLRFQSEARGNPSKLRATA